jgi:hypothetical protein
VPDRVWGCMRGTTIAAIIVGLGALICPDVTFTKASSREKCRLSRGANVVAVSENGVISSLTRPVPTRPKYTEETETDWWACLNRVGR